MKKTALTPLQTTGLTLSLAVFMLLAIEVGLRVTLGTPKGVYRFLEVGPNGMFPPNQRIVMVHGIVPYVIETNALGLRGKEITQTPDPQTVRIATVGDSVTQGFYVENNGTYPFYLEEALHDKGVHAEVVNLAAGGGSISKQLSIYREVGVNLHPKIVIITFVGNDLLEILPEKESEMTHYALRKKLSWADWAKIHTAIGEYATVLRQKMTQAYYFSDFEALLSDERYKIPGGNQFAENVKRYCGPYRAFCADGLNMDAHEPQVQEGFRRYFKVLDEFQKQAQQNNTRIVLVYFPAYPEIYSSSTDGLVAQTLDRYSKEHHIAFLDLTAAFRGAPKGAVLHFAPLDYHPNPAGNQLMARAIADFLLQDKDFRAHQKPQ